MSLAWPEEAVWLRFAAPMVVLGAMPLATAFAPGVVFWRHALAGPMLAAGMIRQDGPVAAPRSAPRLRAVGRGSAPRAASRITLGQGGHAGKARLTAVPTPGSEA